MSCLANTRYNRNMFGIVSIIFGAIELLVGLRFIFRILGANPQTFFVAWTYDISSPLVAPFAGIFGQPALPTGGAVVQGVFELSTLVALVVYAAIAGILIRLSYGR